MERAPLAYVIDIALLILCLRTIYSAISRGIICEVFKLAGVFFSSLCAFHWYTFIDNHAGKLSFLNKQYLNFISFLAIFFAIQAIFSLTRLIVTSLVERKEIPLKERWLLFFVGGFRAVFLSSLILFMAYLSPFEHQYAAESLSWRVFKNIAPKTYLLAGEIFRGIGNKDLVVNKEVQEYYETATFLPGDNSKRH